MAETGWTKTFPVVDGDYLCRINEHDLSPVSFRMENGAIYEYGCGKNLRSDYHHHAADYEFLGPFTAADFEQLTRLREAAHMALKWLDWIATDPETRVVAPGFTSQEAATALRNALGTQEGKANHVE